MKKLVRLLALLSALSGALHFLRIRSPRAAALSLPKILAGALSPYLAVLSINTAGLAAVNRLPLALAAALFGFWAAARYVWQVASSGGDFAAAFGADWEKRLATAHRERMLGGRWTWLMPRGPEPVHTRDLTYWTLTDPATGSKRHLLADLWQPPEGVAPSGLAYIYFHGSGWHFLDKDSLTRPYFRHLAGQGHVILDVAYRLCPETDWRGMLGDVQRAIVWMKEKGPRYGVDPARVVLGGGSAGGHLALLAAYTAEQPALRAPGLGTADLQVQGVVSAYGITDLAAYDRHAGQLFNTPVSRHETASDKITRLLIRATGLNVTPPAYWQEGETVQDNMMRALLGGTTAEAPDVVRLASPITHAGAQSPPTLLLHGDDDAIVPAAAARELAAKLRQAGVPVVHVEYPQTEHAFDLFLPRISPPAQAALYETERFLAVLAAA